MAFISSLSSGFTLQLQFTAGPAVQPTRGMLMTEELFVVQHKVKWNHLGIDFMFNMAFPKYYASAFSINISKYPAWSKAYLRYWEHKIMRPASEPVIENSE